MTRSDAPNDTLDDAPGLPGDGAPPSPLARQPWLGLAGLGIIAAAGALVGLLPGPQLALELFGPWTTFALPVLAVAALWFGNWPVAGASRAVGGAVLTVGTLAGGLLLTAVGQAVVGSAAPAHLLGTSDEAAAGHLVSFPFTVPLAALVFATTLQLTFVTRKWPFAQLPPVPAGLAALGTSWLVGTGLYLTLTNWDSVPAPARAALGLRNPGGPVDALDLIAIVLCVVIWQMIVFFLLAGYPFSLVTSPVGYLVAANVATVALGVGTWLLLHDGLGLPVPTVSAVAGSVVFGTLVTGLLLEQWPARLLADRPGAQRLALVATAAGFAALGGLGLHALALAAQDWTRDPVNLWVAVAGLNFLGATVIVHVAFWRRWPLPAA